MHVSSDEVNVVELRANLKKLLKPRRRNADRTWILAADGVLVQSVVVECHAQVEGKVLGNVLHLHATFVVEKKSSDAAAADAVFAFAWNSRLNRFHRIAVDRRHLWLLQHFLYLRAKFCVAASIFTHN